MHLQVRCQPKSSPADVDKVLELVAGAGIDLVAVGGSDLEFGGELALVPEHGKHLALLDTLAAYHPRLLDSRKRSSGLTFDHADHKAGGLRAVVARVSEENLATGRIIRDILIGVQDDAERAARKVPVQIYSEVVRSVAGLIEPEPDPEPDPNDPID